MDIQYNHIRKITTEEALDLNNSILIIGPASDNKLSGEIIGVKNIDDIFEVYGDSELSRAAQYAFNNNVSKIYLYNTYETEGYINIASKFKHYDFDYIVPIGINISDKFYNPVSKTMVSYADFYLDNLSEDAVSTIIMTDKHAELYYDLDHYMMEMEDILYELKKNSTYKGMGDKWTNIIFVCNMLASVEYSNIVLATSLALTSAGKYPANILSEAVYDYDTFDMRNKDVCYFKDNVLSNDTSIENLLNMRMSNDAYKSVLVDRVIKYIKRNMDLSKYIGTKFTKNTKMHIANDVRRFMNSIDGTMIKNYTIKSIEFVLTGPNVGNILIDTEITPRGTFEKLNVSLGV